MLIRFNVKNFLSFHERADGTSEEFSMIAGKVQNKKSHLHYGREIKLLKFAAIYGANASGKSNLVNAMSFMRNCVITELTEVYKEKYYKLNLDCKDKASYFEVEVELSGKYYRYGFEVLLNQGKYVSEWLVELNNKSEELLFERDILNGKYELGKHFTNTQLRNKLNIYADDIKDDTSVLFLTIMNRNKINFYKENTEAFPFQRVFRWFRNSLNIIYPNNPISDYNYLTTKNDVEKICKIISALGTGITGYEVIDIPFEKALEDLKNHDAEGIIPFIKQELEKFSKETAIRGLALRTGKYFYLFKTGKNNLLKCETICFKHGSNDVYFNLDEESDGTIRILDLINILLSNNAVYVIDELDRCLHPSLTFNFVRYFLEIAKNKKIQLIATTHESRLLDFDLLRRDEIWFVNKNSSGSSDIYSLEEYNERFDRKIDKAYLEGRYGGVPIFTTLFPVEETIEE